MNENEFINLLSKFKNNKNSKGYIAHCISNGATPDRKDFFLFEPFDFKEGKNVLKKVGEEFSQNAGQLEDSSGRTLLVALINNITIPKIFEFATKHNYYICNEVIDIMHEYTVVDIDIEQEKRRLRISSEEKAYEEHEEKIKERLEETRKRISLIPFLGERDNYVEDEDEESYEHY